MNSDEYPGEITDAQIAALYERIRNNGERPDGAAGYDNSRTNPSILLNRPGEFGDFLI